MPGPTRPSPAKFVAALVLVLALTAMMCSLMLGMVGAKGIEGFALRGLFLSAPLVCCLPLLLLAVPVVWPRPAPIRGAQLPGTDLRGVVLRHPVVTVAAAPLAALALGTYCGVLVLMCWSDGAPRGDVHFQFVTAYWLSVVAAVVSLGYSAAYLVELLRGRIARGHLALTPQGVHVRTRSWDVHVPWTGVGTVSTRSDTRRQVDIFPGGRAGHVRRTSRLLREPRPVDLGLVVPTDLLAGAPEALADVVRHYRDHPEARAELADERGVRRVRDELAGARR